MERIVDECETTCPDDYLDTLEWPESPIANYKTGYADAIGEVRAALQRLRQQMGDADHD